MTTPAEFRATLSQWASGVSVVTANEGGLLYGLTVSSFASVSLDPPLISVCLASGNRLVGMIERSRAFAVSILAHDQAAASQYFARSGREPTQDFTEIEGEWADPASVHRQPVVRDALGWMACEVHAAIPAGDHTLVIGRVDTTVVNPGRRPLVYWDRAYRDLG
ncbi:MAG: flavin reductase family protein [Myxococcota bacterium]